MKKTPIGGLKTTMKELLTGFTVHVSDMETESQKSEEDSPWYCG